jgi:hypothetical protein
LSDKNTGAAKQLNDAAVALTKLSKAATNASGTVKRLRKGLGDLFSFDEINRLSTFTSSSSSSSKSSGRRSSSSGSRSGGGSATVQLNLVKNLSQWLEKLLNPLRELWSMTDWGAVEGLDKLTNAAAKLGEQLKSGLQWGYENVLKPLGNWVMQDAAPAVCNLLAGALEVLSGVLAVLAPIAQTVWEDFLQPIASWTGGVIVSVLDGLGNAFQYVGEKLQDLSIFIGKKDGLLSQLGTLANGIVQILMNGLGKAFQAAGSKISGWFQEHISNPFKKKLDELGNLVVRIGVGLKETPQQIWNYFKEKWGQNRTVQTAVSLVKNGWSTVSKFVGTKISVGIGLVKSGWKTVKGWLGDLTATFKIKLPKVSVQWYGTPIALPHFNVTWNAKGAILNGAQLFGMAGNTLLGGGEAGREAVLPLESNTGWMDKIADKVVSRMGSSEGEQTINVTVTLDRQVVGKTVVKYINGERNRTGKSPVLI